MPDWCLLKDMRLKFSIPEMVWPSKYVKRQLKKTGSAFISLSVWSGWSRWHSQAKKVWKTLEGAAERRGRKVRKTGGRRREDRCSLIDTNSHMVADAKEWPEEKQEAQLFTRVSRYLGYCFWSEHMTSSCRMCLSVTVPLRFFPSRLTLGL